MNIGALDSMKERHTHNEGDKGGNIGGAKLRQFVEITLVFQKPRMEEPARLAHI